jgi:outer membrane protein assembly factor BamD
MEMKKKIIYVIGLVLALSSCSQYQKLLKSTDNELKYKKAQEYHNKGDYVRAYTLLEDVIAYYRGTPEAAPIQYLLADSYFGNKDYETAINYYSSYVRNFPNGEQAMECSYMIGYCYYKISPEPKLDQAATHSGIAAFDTFLENYSYSERATEAQKLKTELEEKLAYKELLNARLYYKLGNYQGNNYQSSIIVSRNVLTEYPDTKYREEFAFLIVKSKYTEAQKSVASKKADRYRNAMEECEMFIANFPNGKYSKDAEKILADTKKQIKN